MTNDLDLVGGSLPAFPFVIDSGAIEPGLTKRELFAAMAMQGYLSNADAWQRGDEKQLANACVSNADALLAALDVSEAKP